MSEHLPAMAVLGATWLHAGFQLVVTLVVYPSLVAVQTAGWLAHHRAHTRRMGGPVAVVYGAAALACGASLLSDSPAGAAGWVAIAATVATFAVTATVGVPLHRRLSRRRDRRDLRLLLAADRFRLLLAVTAALAAATAIARP